MEFIAEDLKSKKIKKLAFILRDLKENVYIYGQKGVGKTFLANFIATQNDLIIENIEIKDFSKIDLNKRLIFTGSKKLDTSLKEKFNLLVEIELEPLSKREKDLKAFIELFIKEVKNNLKIDKDFEITNLDISENLNSLKRSIYKSALLYEMHKNEMIECIEKYFLNNNDLTYDEALKIFEKGLFEAYYKKYSSKLQMSKVLKLNRGTLAKKMKGLK